MANSPARFVVIGGSDAGISAALRARQVNPSMQITLLLADAYPNYSICGLPFYISGETPEWRQLAHRTEFPGIEIRPHHLARAIDPLAKTVLVERDGAEVAIPYDRLLIATGARPVRPEIPGLSLPGVFCLHTMENAFDLQEYLAARRPESVAIVGSGYIGLEMADAFTHLALKVTLIGSSPAVLPTVDTGLGRRVEQELRRYGVTAESGFRAHSIDEVEGRLCVRTDSTSVKADMVLVAAGVEPNAGIGKAAGVLTGAKGALRVNSRMETSVPGIYAAGDCAETWHRVMGAYTYQPLGTTSHKQGRVAGENAAGGNREFQGCLGTQVVKVFELVIARTGLLDHEARRAGFDAWTVESEQFDHKAYYPGARKLVIRVTGDRKTGRLLGAQILGPWGAEISKRIDIFATALYHGMSVEDVNDIDLSYTPPLGSPWDAVQMACQGWEEIRSHE